MAQIPMGRFGNRVAQPGPVTQVRTGDPLAEATNRTLGVAADVANDNQAAQTRLDLQAADEAERKARDAREAADRIKKATALQGAQFQIETEADTISQGILDGSIPRDKAEQEFQSRAGKVIDATGKDLDENTRALIGLDLQRQVFNSSGKIKDAAQKRDRQDVSAGIAQVSEFTARLYKTDPAKATAQFMATVDGLGQHSDMSPQQLATLKQTWLEGTQFTEAQDLINANQDSMAGLAKARKHLETLQHLDPNKRSLLDQRISLRETSLENKARAEQERRDRAADRLLRQAEAAWKQGMDLSESGILSEAQGDRLLQAMNGTTYAESFKTFLQAQRETGPVAMQPTRVLQAELDRIQQRKVTEGVSEELLNQEKRIQKVMDAQVSDMRKHGDLRAWGERGVGLPQAVDFNKVPLPAAADVIAQRVDEWEAISQRKGSAGDVLYPEELETLRDQILSMPYKDQAAAAATLSSKLPPKMAAALAQQMAGKSNNLADKAVGYAFQFGSSMTTGSTGLFGAQVIAPRQRSEIVMRGADAIRKGEKLTGPDGKAVSPDTLAPVLNDFLQGSFASDEARQSFMEAISLTAFGLASEGGKQISEAVIEQARRLVTQSDFVPRGQMILKDGKQQPANIPLPPFVKADEFDAKLVSAAESQIGQVVIAGGREMPRDVFLKTLPRAALMPVGEGQYIPLVNNRGVMNPDGSRLILKVR